ncbi:hypothetical protein CEXT_108761 [Caerostris extrusa]|uniref:Uncharacterized protein n=1 Tax=Caerostris extrusa TaxID=172846 RepID=A0AAV4P838_CAEEX|nr:hypothetical protein CEXT_108761 [Caerostris extrusa]
MNSLVDGRRTYAPKTRKLSHWVIRIRRRDMRKLGKLPPDCQSKATCGVNLSFESNDCKGFELAISNTLVAHDIVGVIIA